MIAAGALRPALVGAQIVVTFAVANVAGAVAAVNYQNQQVRSAKAAVETAGAALDAQLKQSQDDGTPQAVLDPLVKQGKDIRSQPWPAAAFVVDKQQLDAINKRADQLKSLTALVQATETQTEVQMHQQLGDALTSLTNDLKPAADAGVDITEYQKFADDTSRTNQALATPKVTQGVLDAVSAKHAALKDATAQHIAANQALQAAQADAKDAVASAQAALTKAQAIPVLKVSDNATAIAALADRLTHISALADFQDLAAKAWAQSSALNTLLSTRQSAYDLLDTTRHEIGLAQGAGKDIASDATQLDAAAKQLDAAGDLPSIQAAKAAIQAVKNDVDSKYWQAIYGAGKVIVVSVQKQELMALQNGVTMLDTLVTTGRPALPTPPGVYNIFYKSSPYHMHSPWPPGDPYWYPDVDMKYAMEFLSGGYFIHDAPWRSAYGPGTNGSNGTHGCINTPRSSGQMDFLYNWADMGTTVVVLAGDFGSHP
jgi:lipoprotein-anchoring transpeptidase ErfK/SrfK